MRSLTFLLFVFLTINLYALGGNKIMSEKIDFDLPSFYSNSLHENFIVEKDVISQTIPGQASELVSRSYKIPEKKNQPFIGAALFWNSYSDSEESGLFLSASIDGKNFEDWIYVENDDDIYPKQGGYSSGLIVLDPEMKYFRIKIEAERSDYSTQIEKLSVEFIYPGFTDNQFTTPSLNNTDDFPKPEVISRTEWGCPDGQDSRWSPNYATVTHLIIHHSAGQNSASDWPAIVRSIWHLHTYSNGWGDVGYNFLIDPFGVIYEGRAGEDNAIGAHYCGKNSNTMGTCVMGTYSSVLPTDPALSSLIQLFTWKCNQMGIDPTGSTYHNGTGGSLANVTGHRNGCATACPGSMFYSIIPSLTEDMKTVLSSTAPSINSEPADGETDFQTYKPLVINFTQMMDTASVRAELSISSGEKMNFYWKDRDRLEVYPEDYWQFSTDYQLTLSDNANSLYGTAIDGDADGNPGGDYVVHFSTIEPDVTSPEVFEYFPQGEDINIHAGMKFNFNEVVDGIIGRVFLYDETNNYVNFTDAEIIEENDITSIVFRPVKALEPGSEYFVTLMAGIQDKYGNKFETDQEYHFKTRAENILEGTLLHQFESETDWIDPASGTQSEGIDPLLTTFEADNLRKFAGDKSGKLEYKFTEPDGYVVLEHNSGFGYLSNDEEFGLWVWGDLSGNEIVFSFNGDEDKYIYGDIDWYGWEFIRIPTTGLNPAQGTLNKIILNHKDGADDHGQIWVDNLQKDAGVTGLNSSDQLPESFAIYQNYPNPFNPETKIRFDLPNDSHVKIEIFDISGRRVAILTNGNLTAGIHEISFTSADNDYTLTSGIYFYRVKAEARSGETFSEVRKMILMK